MKIKTLIIIFAVVLICVAIFYCILHSTHKQIIDGRKSYEPQSIFSEDGQFLLITEKVEESTGTYATFRIEDVNRQETIFECPNKYRTWDLKSIKWKSFDVVVDSSDVGTITYKYNSGN